MSWRDHLKAPAWGATAAGAAIGLYAGPHGVVVGAMVGALIDWGRHVYREHHWRAVHPLRELHMRAVRLAAPHIPDEIVQRQAAAMGATPPHAALALQGYLDRHSTSRNRAGFWAADTTRRLVAAFQAAYNADPRARDLGRLNTGGSFGPKTAAALTLYVHESVSPDPNAAEGA